MTPLLTSQRATPKSNLQLPAAQMSDESISVYQRCIDRLRAGDPSARDELLNRSCSRLQHLARRMLADFPGVRRWEQTDDVLQNAALRLWKSLEEVEPESVRHFFNLAALQVRRELIELARRHFGPQGLGRHHDTDGTSPTQNKRQVGETTLEPGRLAAWTEFHERIDDLPEEQREIFHLLWYQELKQSEAAELLNVSERTVKRRWQAARLKLYEILDGELPGRQTTPLPLVP